MKPAHETGFLDRVVSVGGVPHRFVVFVPHDFDSSKRWPIVLFLHGSGERGSDNVRQTAIGVANAIRFGAEVHAIVVFPQAPLETRWVGEPVDVALSALDQSVKEYNGDPDRIYLTGLSMGGYGTWHLAMMHPERFAAIAVVCGGILPSAATTSVIQSPLSRQAADPYEFTAHAVRNLPIWVFHGADDPVIPVSEARKMVEALKNEGADVRYTEYPGVGHDAWTRTYSNPEFWKWFFEQRRK